MLEVGLLSAATATGALVAAYWICMIVGGGLLLVAALGGHGSDADVDVDVGADFDTDFHADFDTDVQGDLGADFDADAPLDADVGSVAHADHPAGHHDGVAGLSTWFSMRFVVFFLAVFGGFGVVLTHLTPTGRGVTLAVALVGGLLIGQGAHQVFRLVRRAAGDSAPRPQDYVQKLARVTIPIVHPDKGEVTLQVRGGERFVPAVVCGAIHQFRSGDEVVVVGYRAGVAQVVSKEEYERRARS